ncbi:histone H3-like centromeric protein A, partial [Camarhynchus parvulus]|uniref:histone H3-like centromeric protein A n=1 Tax=Geospiza parvula TaxID=87175 RepID=UPI00123821F8
TVYVLVSLMNSTVPRENSDMNSYKRSPSNASPGHCPGQQALQEICRYQSRSLLLHPGPFAHLVREICLLFTRGVDYRWQSMALLALQEAAEAFMVRLLEDAYMCSLHAHRVTLFPKDLQLAWRLRGPEGGHLNGDPPEPLHRLNHPGSCTKTPTLGLSLDNLTPLVLLGPPMRPSC